jgi:hypothetical protein
MRHMEHRRRDPTIVGLIPAAFLRHGTPSVVISAHWHANLSAVTAVDRPKKK